MPTGIEIDISYLKWQIDVFFETDSKFVIVPKGRRVGATRGGINAMFEWALDGISPMLWVDTINGNIDRYFERYMLPNLKQLNSKNWNWNANKKILHILNSVIDFRSADAPESIEGFGYKRIILNEAGIILKDDYLFNNAILPMMLDYPESKLFAIGVPKGIHKRDGNEHMFHVLYQRALNGEPGYALRQLSTFDNEMLDAMEINMLMDEMATEAQRSQEIHGMFVDDAGTNPFATAYNPDVHASNRAIAQRDKQLFISIDFNLNPFGAIFSHIWRDVNGIHCHTFDEIEIQRGSIPAMITEIQNRYLPWLSNCVITGDSGGRRGDLSQSDQQSYFEQLRRGLNLRPSQIVVPNVPSHEQSRNDCNYILHWTTNDYSGFDVAIHPTRASGLCRDLSNVQCDSFNQILKRNRRDASQRADLLDCWRYLVNTFMRKSIESHQRTKPRMTK